MALAENTPQYVAYTQAINDLEKDQRDLEDLRDAKLEQVFDLETKRIPYVEGLVAQWLAAGSSDRQNRENKIAHYRNVLDQEIEKVGALKDEIDDLNNQIEDLQDEIDAIDALRTGYVNTYNENISKGISPVDAAALAKEEMEIQTAEGLFTKSRNTLFIIGGAIALIAIITIIIIFKKK